METIEIQIGQHQFKLRPPTDVEYDRLIDARSDPLGGRSKVEREIMLAILKSPTPAEASAIFARQPAVKALLRKEIRAITGESDEEADETPPDGAERAVRLGGQVYALRRPSEDEFDAFVNLAGSSTAGAMGNLVRDCAVSPTGEDLEAALESKPGHKLRLGGILQEMAGASLEVTRGKPQPC